MALACSAEMTARFSARAPREWSRAVVTVKPSLSVVAYAPARRTASSGVISTFRIPVTPRAEKMRLTARLPDHRGVDEGTGLDGLERIDAYVSLDDRFFTDEAFVADDSAVLDPRGPHDVGLPDYAAPQIAVLTDVHVVDDGPVQKGPALDDDVGADDGVLTDFGVRFDLGVLLM